jgi:hypothetical protein
MSDQNDERLKAHQEVILGLWSLIHQLRAGEQAMAKIILELKPHVSLEVYAVLTKYSDYRDEIYQDQLLQLEKSNVWLATQLDKHRPPISKDEESD